MNVIVAAARVLNARAAEQCDVDAEDQWKVYGEGFLLDAEAALIAAGVPELLEVLQEAWAKPTITEGADWWGRVAAVLTKATGATP